MDGRNLKVDGKKKETNKIVNNKFDILWMIFFIILAGMCYPIYIGLLEEFAF